MKDRLYINDVLVDLHESESPALTMQVNDISELANRQASYTNQIRLPDTQTNRLLFESANVIQSETNIPYQRLSCRYIHEGIEVIPKGFAKYDGFDGTNHLVIIYSGIVNFFDLIKDKYLSDLDLSDLNHLWEKAYVLAAASATEGIIYPVVAFTEESSFISNANNKIYVDRMLPFIFCHTLVTRICQSVGFSFPEESYFNSDYFKKIILQVSCDKWAATGKILMANVSVNETFSSASGISTLNFWDDSSGNATLKSGTYDVGSNFDGHTFTFPNDVQVPSTFKLRVKGNYSVTATETYYGHYTIRLMYIDGASDVHELIAINTPLANVNQSVQDIFTFDLPAGNYDAGGLVYVTVEPHREYLVYSSTDRLYFTLWKSLSFFSAETFNELPIEIGDPVDISLNMPKIKQTDFLKAMAQMAALTFDTDSDTLQLYQTPFKTIAANKSKAKDWSDKLDARTPSTDFKIGKYARKNWMRFSESEAVTKFFGDGYFEIKDETLEAEQEMFTLPFSATESKKLLVDLDIPKILRWDDSGVLNIKTEPRILILKNDLYSASVEVWDNTSSSHNTVTPAPYCYFQNVLCTENLGFDNSLIVDWYSEIISMLNQARVLIVDLKLSPSDIESFPPKDEDGNIVPIYFDRLNNYFILNKINNWQSGQKLTSCEIIRI